MRCRSWNLVVPHTNIFSATFVAKAGVVSRTMISSPRITSPAEARYARQQVECEELVGKSSRRMVDGSEVVFVFSGQDTEQGMAAGSVRFTDPED